MITNNYIVNIKIVVICCKYILNETKIQYILTHNLYC